MLAQLWHAVSLSYQQPKSHRVQPTAVNLKRLEYFLALLECGRFTVAAEQCCVSQQGLSKAIAKLEKELGVKLLDRNAYGVKPTIYGEVLARHARIMVAAGRIAGAELMAVRGAKYGMVRIGVGPTLEPQALPRILRQFMARRRGYGIRIVTDVSRELYTRLLAGDLDVVVSAPPSTLEIDAELQIEKVFEERDLLHMRAGHPVLVKPRIALADLAQYPWVADDKNADRWLTICDAFASANESLPSQLVRANSIGAALGMLLELDAMVVCSEHVYIREVELGQLRRVEVPGLVSRRVGYIASRRSITLLPSVGVLMPIIRQVCREVYATQDATRTG